MAEMRPPLSPTSNNVKRASEKGASQTSKKQRLGDTPLPSGVADQERPPKDVAPRDKPQKNDVDMTRGDARPTELVDVKMEPVGAKDDAPEEEAKPDDVETWAAEGFVSDAKVVDAKVAEVVAELAKDNAPKKKQIEDALKALPDLEAKVGNGITGNDCTDFCKKWSLPSQRGKKEQIPGRLRTLLEKKQKEMVGQQKLDGERAVLNTTLSLEFEAFDALADSDKEGVVGWRSVYACASLMAGASSDCLTRCRDGESGNINQLANALGDSKVELVAWIDGVKLEKTNENIVLGVMYSLERAINARPPQEVVEAVLGRIRLLKHAPRANKACCAALEASLRREARSFAAQDAASAEKVTVDLGPLPLRDAAAVAERDREYKKWTAAPPAKLAAVWSGAAGDSYALGTEAALQQWPEWQGRPTIVAEPLTEIGGVELGKIKEMDVLAKKLAHGEKGKGKKRKIEQEGGDSEEEEEEESG